MNTVNVKKNKKLKSLELGLLRKCTSKEQHGQPLRKPTHTNQIRNCGLYATEKKMCSLASEETLLPKSSDVMNLFRTYNFLSSLFHATVSF